MIEKEFGSRVVSYCTECGRRVFDVKQCEHELTPLRLEISNGAIQVRMYCKKCFYLDGKSLKQSDYDLTTLLLKKHSDYTEFKTKRFLEEKQQIDEFLKQNCPSLREVYDDYIISEQWKKVRDEIMQRDEYICRICGGAATEVHHLTYRHLKSEYEFELVSLCRKCHESYRNNL